MSLFLSMGVDVNVYRAAIGLFNRFKLILCKLDILFLLFTFEILFEMFFIVQLVLLLLSVDVELNPGPVLHSMLFGHFNARSICAQDKFEEIVR